MTEPEQPKRWNEIALDTLRDYYRDIAERTSLRTAAAHVPGLGHSTLHNFLGGAEPQPRIRRLLAETYMAAMGILPEGADPARERTASAALEILADFFPPSARRGFKRSMERAMAEELKASGQPVPEWLAARLGQE